MLMKWENKSWPKGVTYLHDEKQHKFKWIGLEMAVKYVKSALLDKLEHNW